MDINTMIRTGISTITTIPYMRKWPPSRPISGARRAIFELPCTNSSAGFKLILGADRGTDAITYLSDRGNKLNWSKALQTI